ncbi:MAG: RDD family protein, partial [Vicinamibacterales bacterium]
LRLEPHAAGSLPSVDRGPDQTSDGSPASAPRRLAAGAIDGAIVLATDLGVLYFTLRLCGLGLADALGIPLVPFAGFLLLLNGGYVAAFTAASGQTIGKMAAGIKVVGVPGSEADARSRVSFGFAALRTVAYLASALPVGLGFVPAFVGRDRRALHDRLAETQVVRVI